MKKVLLISSRSDHGGGPKHLLDIANRYPKELTYIASPSNEPYALKFKNVCKEHFEIPHRKFSLKKVIELFTFLKVNQVKVIHSHGRGAGSYSRLFFLFGYTVIHTYHGIHLKNDFRSIVSNFIDRILSSFTDKLIFVSNSEKSNALGLGLAPEDKSFVIENGVSISSAKEFKNLDSPIILGTLTRLDSHKNNGELIRLIRNNSQFHLKIAGDGPERLSLDKMAVDLGVDKRVHFLGNTSNPIDFINTIDIYVSSSKGEGLPYSVLEAMANSRPCLLSKVSGHIDLVDDSQLFASPKEFNNKLKNISLNYTEISQRNFLTVKESFEIDKQIQKVTKLYQ